MWERHHKVWKLFQKNLMAKDYQDAVFLSAYMRYSHTNRSDLHTTEVIDLQRYKRIKKPLQVKRYLKEMKEEPFVFFFCRN
jgi:hypothetical protein